MRLLISQFTMKILNSVDVQTQSLRVTIVLTLSRKLLIMLAFQSKKHMILSMLVVQTNYLSEQLMLETWLQQTQPAPSMIVTKKERVPSSIVKVRMAKSIVVSSTVMARIVTCMTLATVFMVLLLNIGIKTDIN